MQVSTRVRRLAMTTVATVTALSLAVLVPAPAQASAEAREGTTRVAVAPAVVRKLDRLGLAATPTKGADAISYEGTVAFRFPITDIANRGKTIKHVGGVKISSGHEYITVKRFTIKLRQGKVAATVVANGDTVGRVDVFNLRGSNRPRLGDVRLTLTGPAARAINQTFGAPAFDRNDNFGFATVITR